MDRRKAELAEKRAKLDALKRAREERRATLAQHASENSSRAETPASERPSSRAQLDDFISSILSPSTSAPSSVKGTQANQQDGSGLPEASTSGRTSRMSDQPALGQGKDLPSEAPASYGPVSALPSFTDTSAELFEFTPLPKITYDKSIQTASTSTSTLDDDLGEGTSQSATRVGSETEAELRARIISELDAERARVDAEIQAEQRLLAQQTEEARKKGLSEDEVSSIVNSSDFTSFLEKGSKVIQRALSDNYDYLRDYSISGHGMMDDREDLLSQGKRVKCTHTFSDEKWTKNRSVTAVDWSLKFPELSVASYTKNPMSSSDPEGLVCVWNLHLLERPEFVFQAQSDVLSVMFSPFHPNLIIGGTYSGQILLWDTRSRSLPVLKTPLSASGHTHPVYSLALPGTQNAHNLVSASTDGTVCAWVLDMLAKPLETLELSHPGHAKTDEVSVTTLAFPDNETGAFFVGTEEGNVFTANRYDRAGAKAGLVQNEIYRGHTGPVLGMDFHPSHGPVDFSDLFLTCGVDWSAKLWRARAAQTHQNGAVPSPVLGSAGNKLLPPHQLSSPTTIHPLGIFEEADDYIFDVKWHPKHPALFGTVDGSGKFHLWNLNQDAEVPVTSTVVNPSAPKALNKLAWETREGRRAAIGSTDGKVYIYDIGETAVPRENEWDLMRKCVGQLAASTGSRQF